LHFKVPSKINITVHRFRIKDREGIKNRSNIGQPQGIAPTKNQMHGENNSRGRPCACPQENETLNNEPLNP